MVPESAVASPTAVTRTRKEPPATISLYNAKGYFEKNDFNAYPVNNLTANPNPDGSVTVQFGDCRKETPNCLPIMPGWNYTVRMYRLRKALVDGSWTFPEARPVR